LRFRAGGSGPAASPFQAKLLTKKADEQPPDAEARAQAEAEAKKKFKALYDAHGRRISSAIRSGDGEPSAAFWRGEPQHLEQDALAFYEQTAAAAAQTGLDELPISVDWEQVNEAVADLARSEARRFAEQATDTSQARASQVIADWIETGGTMDELLEQVAGVWEGPRADVAAVTEVTRLYATGNATAWEASNVVTAMVWRTAEDEKVCDVCGPLDDAEIAFDGALPPAHPNCRCWVVPKVKGPDGL